MFEIGKIYHAKWAQGAEETILFKTISTRGGFSHLPLASSLRNPNQQEWRFSIKHVHDVKEVPKEDLPLYLGIRFIFPGFKRVLNEI